MTDIKKARINQLIRCADSDTASTSELIRILTMLYDEYDGDEYEQSKVIERIQDLIVFL